MADEHVYPEGAIKTVEELMTIFRQGNGKLYKVYNFRGTASEGHPPHIDTIAFSRGAHVAFDQYGLLIASLDGRDVNDANVKFFCPCDCNIKAHHNYHYIFADRALAERHLATIKGK